MSMQDDKKNFDRIYNQDKDKKKKTPWLLVAAVALVLVAVILLAVFLKSYTGVIHLSSNDNGVTFTDKLSGVTYELAPMCYEPIAIWSDKTYAKYGDMIFYTVRDAEPKEYICSKYSGAYDLYYSSDITLPSLEEFEASHTRVCKQGVIAINTHSIEEKTVDIVSYFLSAETVDHTEITNVRTTLYLKLMSEKYDFMYYNITYYRTQSGQSYLFDRTTGRCVSLGDRFVEDIEGADNDQ